MEFDFANVADGPVNGPPAPRTDLGHNEESAVTPRFGLSYKTDSGNHFYVTAAKGFRPGGANAPLRNLACVPDLAEIGLSEVPLTYDSDSLWSYEVGTKLALVDNRLRLNASGFQIDWTDIINNVSLDCILSFTTNLGKARSRGWDIDVQYQPIESLLLSIALGDTNAEYTQSVYGVNPDGSPNTDVTLVTKGDALMGSSFRAYTSAQYSFKGVGGEPAYVRADYSHQGQNDRSVSENTGNVGVDEVWRDPSIDNLDLRLGQKFGGWELSLFVKNALNDTPVIGKGRTFTGGSVQGSSHLFTGFTTRPRTFGLSAMYRR
jgi:outer membrane receptor protein involved in Fe transport